VFVSNEIEEQTQIPPLEMYFTPVITVTFKLYLPKEKLCCQAWLCVSPCILWGYYWHIWKIQRHFWNNTTLRIWNCTKWSQNHLHPLIS